MVGRKFFDFYKFCCNVDKSFLFQAYDSIDIAKNKWSLKQRQTDRQIETVIKINRRYKETDRQSETETNKDREKQTEIKTEGTDTKTTDKTVSDIKKDRSEKKNSENEANVSFRLLR